MLPQGFAKVSLMLCRRDLQYISAGGRWGDGEREDPRLSVPHPCALLSMHVVRCRALWNRGGVAMEGRKGEIPGDRPETMEEERLFGIPASNMHQFLVEHIRYVFRSALRGAPRDAVWCCANARVRANSLCSVKGVYSLLWYCTLFQSRAASREPTMLALVRSTAWF